MKITLVGAGGHHLVQPALRIAEAAGEGVLRHDGKPDLVGDHDGLAVPRGERLGQRRALGLDIGLGQHAVGQPERQAVDQHRPSGGQAVQRAREVVRGVERLPPVAAARAVERDALHHLLVIGLRGGDVAPRAGQALDQFLGVPALAGAGAAEDEGQAHACAAKRGRSQPARPPSSTQNMRLTVTEATTKLWCSASGIGVS